jgi:hypothetical protein
VLQNGAKRQSCRFPRHLPPPDPLISNSKHGRIFSNRREMTGIFRFGFCDRWSNR